MALKFRELPWDTFMLAGFAFAIPLMIMEFLEPGLITSYLPLHFFAFPFAFIIPAAFQSDSTEEPDHPPQELHENHVC